jgi:hypothetical protein
VAQSSNLGHGLFSAHKTGTQPLAGRIEKPSKIDVFWAGQPGPFLGTIVLDSAVIAGFLILAGVLAVSSGRRSLYLKGISGTGSSTGLLTRLCRDERNRQRSHCPSPKLSRPH